HAGDPCTGGGICGSTCNESTDDCFASAATVCRSSAGVCDVAENCTGASTTCPADSFSSGNTCRAANGVCDVAETCSGASASCPADGFAGAITCRAATDECDAAEVCSGSATCPADGKASNSTPCSTDGNVCTDDFCNGTGTCAHTNNTGPCDDGTFCNGPDTCLAGSCTVHPGDPCAGGIGTCAGACNEATNACDGGDGNVCDDGLFCNGTDICGGGTCSQHSGDPCTGGSVCQDSCNEAADTCNDDLGSACTTDGNVCTDDECNGAGTCVHNNNTAPCSDGLFCNGPDTCAGGTCSSHAGDPCIGGGICGSTCNEGPDNCFASGATVCRSVAGVCDVAENCTGASASCPADSFTSGNTCRGSAGICDVAETCSGASASCPADGFASSATTCRAAGSVCDVAEVCSGAATCPADAFASSSTPCASDSNVCTDDLCDGSGTCGHTNNTAPCDDATFCNGTDVCASGTCTHAGDPCLAGGECADTCDEDADTCFSDSNTPCTDDVNDCTDDHCSGTGTCAHTANTAPCDDGTFCNGPDICAAGTCSSHLGDPCTGNPICSSVCDELANDCNDTDGLDCSDACTEGTCTDGQCEGVESLLSPTCRWIVIGGVGPVSEGNTVKTTGIRNDAGSLADGSVCGFFSKRSRGVVSGHYVVTAGVGQGVKGFAIKFSVGADVLGDIATGGAGVRVGQVGNIPGTELKQILFGQIVEKLDADLQGTGTYIDTTSEHPLVDVCDDDQDKLANAVPLIDALPADVSGTKYRVKPGGLATIDATGMGTGVFSYTSVKISGRAQIRLVGGPMDVLIIRSAGDIKIGKGANISLSGGIVPENVLFYGKGRRCKTGRQVIGAGTWFCPAARKFQIGTGAEWTGTWLGGVKDVRIRRRAQLSYAPFSGL
ncbi:MAG TPA: hypothetical protein VN634_01545, partial [Candidatus Limnocylindrales bacterium]|nr:hypothetical protein [Candidatus Limnocylindrales bacterium]